MINRLLLLYLIIVMFYDLFSYRIVRYRNYRNGYIKLNNNENSNSYWNTIEPIIYNEIGLKEKLSTYEDKYQQDSIDNNYNNNNNKNNNNNNNNNNNSNYNDNNNDINISSTTKLKTENQNKKINLPFFDVNSLGISGRWIEQDGNFVLRPQNSTYQSTSPDYVAPLGVIHFLGGAFVGAAPHITYRYLLEALCDEGYVIVATPYRLDMDYVRSCDSILTKFDAVAIELAEQYGPVPVIGLGHSCGALLQTLITSLFPDTPRAVNILISYNNKPASKAIPAFEEVIVPICEQVMGDNTQSINFRETLGNFRTTIDQAIDNYSDSQLAPSFLGKEIVPFIRQSLEILDQFPPLMKIIANGKREFEPSPIDTKEVCRRMYRARRTLLIKFANDELDESEGIEKVLNEANTIMRMKRPMIEMQVDMKILTGTHITPLTQNIILDPPSNLGDVPLPDLLQPLRNDLRNNFLLTINDVKSEIVNFLKNTGLKGNF